MNKERLLQLADHLEHGPMGHTQFEFRVINQNEEGGPDYECGTMGCAVGEFPIVWPDIFMFITDGSIMNSKNDKADFDAAEEWLDITEADSSGLFVPSQNRDWAEGRLSSNATKEQVATNIREFVAWKEANA